MHDQSIGQPRRCRRVNVDCEWGNTSTHFAVSTLAGSGDYDLAHRFMLIDEGAAQTYALAATLGVQDVSQAHALGAILLAAFTLVTILHDGLSSVNWPKRLSAFAALLSSPFQNFLTIDDLKDIGPSKTPAVWKTRALTALALLNSVGWLAFLAYTLVIDNTELAVQALVAAITWVCEGAFCCFLADFPPGIPLSADVVPMPQHTALHVHPAGRHPRHSRLIQFWPGTTGRNRCRSNCPRCASDTRRRTFHLGGRNAALAARAFERKRCRAPRCQFTCAFCDTITHDES